MSRAGFLGTRRPAATTYRAEIHRQSKMTYIIDCEFEIIRQTKSTIRIPHYFSLFIFVTSRDIVFVNFLTKQFADKRE